jgi:hypothetical protein
VAENKTNALHTVLYRQQTEEPFRVYLRVSDGQRANWVARKSYPIQYFSCGACPSERFCYFYDLMPSLGNISPKSLL